MLTFPNSSATLKLTPFRLENIPPPMSSMLLPSSRPSWTPVHVSFSSTSSTLIELYSDGFVETWAWPLVPAVRGKAREEIKAPTLVRSSHAFGVASPGPPAYARQCACVGEESDLVVAVLQSSRRGNSVVLVDSTGATRTVEIMGGAIRLVAGEDSFIVELDDGTILEGELLPSLRLIETDPFSFCSPRFDDWRRRCPSLRRSLEIGRAHV